MKKSILIIVLFSAITLYSQNNDSTTDNIIGNNNTNEDNSYNFTNPFRIYNIDKYYTGWQDPRAFIGRLYFSKNFDLEKNLMKRYSNTDWDFGGVSVNIEGRVASEIMFYRNKYFSVGAAAAIEILMLGRTDGRFDVYDLSGQFAAYVDLWLKNIIGIDLKIRIYPVYHQSTHLVDGFRGKIEIRNGSSYEFASALVYYYLDNFTIYGGVEGTFNAIGNGAPLFRGHVGLDYRYPIYEYINFITGINVAAIYDKVDRLKLIKEPWHAAVNFGIGVEFYRYTISLKVSFQRPRGASTYFDYATQVGAELSLFF